MSISSMDEFLQKALATSAESSVQHSAWKPTNHEQQCVFSSWDTLPQQQLGAEGQHCWRPQQERADAKQEPEWDWLTPPVWGRHLNR